jgi:phosphate/sulfate permease
MSTVFFIIVIFLVMLAVFDLVVGVSNDAVNFLNSAIGAKAAKFKTILFIASMGVAAGALLSNGMMDIARHGIMMPQFFTFHEVMVIFLAVMATDVVLLDVFNTLGLPTSTTVSMVFELLGGTFMIASFKAVKETGMAYSSMINTDKALEVILGIFLSVAIAFIFGTVVQWLCRVIYTFNYKKHLRYAIALFGGISITSLCYFMFIKGVKNTPIVSDSAKAWIDQNTHLLVLYTFIFSTILTEVLHLLKVNIFRLVTLIGTFALAMAFAGNDLVNFIGVPLAGLSSYQDVMANGGGAFDTFHMSSLLESAKTPASYLLAAAAVMIVAMITSKKARNVIKTSVDLSRQDESEEMFGSSRAARSIVRFTTNFADSITRHVPVGARKWMNSRFNTSDIIAADGAAFDMLRAAVNLVLSGMLIIIGTNLKLPLSTTYVTFMVAMGTSLADRAWDRDSAVYRVTGVLSVIGGWFITAGVAFVVCALVAMCMYFGGFAVMAIFMVLDVYLIVRSNIRYSKKIKEEKKDSAFAIMMRSRDPEIVWEMLNKQVSRTQSGVCNFALDEYKNILDGLSNNDLRTLRRSDKSIKGEQDILKKSRRQELLALRRSPNKIAIERNTWFHLGANSDQQFMYCLRRMLAPIKEHIDNGFTPLPESYKKQYAPVRSGIEELMKNCSGMISTGHYDAYYSVLDAAEKCKDDLSVLRKNMLDNIQQSENMPNIQVSLVYLNLLQESQEFLSIMRHHLRAAYKFIN